METREQNNLSNHIVARLSQRLNEATNKENIRMEMNELVGKCFQTTMFTSVSACEEGFGHFWGHGLKREEKTPEQIEYTEIWMKIRELILNKGNAQSRRLFNFLKDIEVKRKIVTLRFDADEINSATKDTL